MRATDYDGLHFDDERLTARRRGGGLVRFTRQERALLLCLQRSPQCVLTRSQLLGALDADGDVSERSIDFLINRLRRKLGDSARDPRYIRTQYGEGYVWIARPAASPCANPFVAIGPVDGEAGMPANRLLHGLRDALAERVAGDQGIVLLNVSPMCASDNPEFGITAGLYSEGARLRGILMLRRGRTQRMLAAERIDTPVRNLQKVLPALAQRLKAAIRLELVEGAPGGTPGPSSEPVYVREIAAERKLSGSPVATVDQRQAPRGHVDERGDARKSLERANAMMAQMMYALGANGTMQPATRKKAETEIETLVLASLPALQDDPLQMLSAAKLLLRLGPVHRELVRQIIDASLQHGSVIAGALALRAQLRMYEGEIDEALGLYDRCLAHAAAATEFRVYLLVLKVYALLAAGRRETVAELCTELHDTWPEARVQLHPAFYTFPGNGQAHVADMGVARIRERVAHAYYMVARHFQAREHQLEFMRCLVAQARAAHGKRGVPADIQHRLPELQ